MKIGLTQVLFSMVLSLGLLQSPVVLAFGASESSVDHKAGKEASERADRAADRAAHESGGSGSGGEGSGPDGHQDTHSGGDGSSLSPEQRCREEGTSYLVYQCLRRLESRETAAAPKPMSGVGLFQIVGQGTIYFSNGTTAYCGFPTPQTLAKSPMSGQVVRQVSQAPAGFRHDPICTNKTQVGPGLFQIGPHIYYSNGVNAYCHIPNGDFFTNVIKAKGSQVNFVREFPALANHGDCKIP